MKIICAGFPKTASKSCSNALRQLGYNVADMRETIIDLSESWVDYLDGKVPIQAVLEDYVLKGYEVNQVGCPLKVKNILFWLIF